MRAQQTEETQLELSRLQAINKAAQRSVEESNLLALAEQAKAEAATQRCQGLEEENERLRNELDRLLRQRKSTLRS